MNQARMFSIAIFVLMAMTLFVGPVRAANFVMPEVGEMISITTHAQWSDYSQDRDLGTSTVNYKVLSAPDSSGWSQVADLSTGQTRAIQLRPDGEYISQPAGSTTGRMIEVVRMKRRSR